MNKIIKPNIKNGFSIDMRMLENGEIVHRGPDNRHDGKIYCTFCGIWANYATVDSFYMKSKNGTTISSGSICKNDICAERCKEDTKTYKRNFDFEQTLLNMEERLSFLTFTAACSKETPVQSSNFVKMLTTKPIHIRHISSFLSTNRDNNQYIHDYKQVDRDAKKYRERCEALMQKRV